MKVSSVTGNSLSVSWNYQGNGQIPDGFMLKILRHRTVNTVVNDGLFVENKTDMTDGVGIINRNFSTGNLIHTFISLTPNTKYMVLVIPYTKSDNFADYLTSGTIPMVEAFTNKIEPSNHATNLSASGITASQITLAWNAPVGEQLPDGYLLIAMDNNAVPPSISDGIPVADQNLTNGLAVYNVAGTGQLTKMFSGLTQNIDYTFKVIPYTNSGNNIDYLTSGAVPYIVSRTSSVSTKIDEIGTANCTVYPIPAKEYLTIDYSVEKKILVNLYNSKGKLVLRILDYTAGQKISLAGMDLGVYVLVLEEGQNKIVRKVVID